MAFVKKEDLKSLHTESKMEAKIWREDYPAYERLADNGLMEGLDPNLPEVNDGSLSAALFKLPKRVYRPMIGTVTALDREEAWLSELANMTWQNEIIPNAITQAPFDRKWKDAIRKAAIYGSVPLITLSTERNDTSYTDFIVAQPQDVILEPGKVSDYDSQVVFWDVYYTPTQLETMIEQAKAEKKENLGEDAYNKWDIPAMQAILKGDNREERTSLDTPRQMQDKAVRPKGFKFCITYQRGVNAPFYMYHKDSNSTVREWTNPDPTGDIPVHFLYCYQDFINPYGIGICKLAGGTQNVLDYMRQADVLATQLGLRPPIMIEGNSNDADIESFVYGQDALWFSGDARVQRMELSDGVYSQLPGRMSMYQASLQKLIPTGDTSLSSTDSGDPTMSKTPAGVKLAAANLSIDDEDFKDNLYVTYEAVAKSMLNTHFANMEGTDFLKLNDDERNILIKGGLEFPQNDQGEMSNQAEIQWDSVRAKFEFKVDPAQDKTADDADKLAGLTKVAELLAADPMLEQDLMSAGKKFNKGELFSEIIGLTTDNDKIVTDISPAEESAMQQQGVDPNAPPAGAQAQAPPAPKMPSESLNYKDAPEDIKRQIEAQAGLTPSSMTSPGQQQLDQAAAQAQAAPADQATQGQPPQPTPEEMQANVDAVMQQYGVDEHTALAALAAEHAGFPPEDVMTHLQQYSQANA